MPNGWPQELHASHAHQLGTRVPFTQHSRQYFFFSFSFEYIHPAGQLRFWFAFYQWLITLRVLPCVFIGHLHILFGELSHQIICPFFGLVILSFYYWVVRVLFNSRYQSLIRYMICKFFLLILWVCLLSWAILILNSG